jgi:Sulfotransferase family
MIINNTFQFIFVHIPKSAGTTVTSVLSRFSSYCDIELGGTPLGEAIQPFFQKRYGLQKHSTFSEIRTVVGDVLLKRYFSFAIVRNPYTRAYSAYKYLSRARREHQIASLADFDKFKDFAGFVNSDYFQGQGYDRMMMPQSIWVARDNKSHDIAVDYIGNVERLEACLDEIGTLVGGGMERRKSEGPLPVLNKSSDGEHAVWSELADKPAVEETIYRRYEVDFRKFGYPRWLEGSDDKVAKSVEPAAESIRSVPIPHQ